MRELKFRVWNICLHEFLPIEAICISKASRLFFCGSVERIYAGGRCFSPYECIIEQYTGLKDRDGKEIYEGDILQYFGATLVVEYHDEAFWAVKYDTKEAWNIRQFIGVSGARVIGNIHENPELLEEEE